MIRIPALLRKMAARCGGRADPHAGNFRFNWHPALSDPTRTAMQKIWYLRALWCTVSLLFSFAQAIAGWELQWTQNGVADTAIWVAP